MEIRKEGGGRCLIPFTGFIKARVLAWFVKGDDNTDISTIVFLPGNFFLFF